MKVIDSLQKDIKKKYEPFFIWINDYTWNFTAKTQIMPKKLIKLLDAFSTEYSRFIDNERKAEYEYEQEYTIRNGL